MLFVKDYILLLPGTTERSVTSKKHDPKPNITRLFFCFLFHVLLQYVNQETGEDLDPTHEKLMEDQERRNMSSDQRRDHDNMNAVHGDAVKASGTWLWRWWCCDVVVTLL